MSAKTANHPIFEQYTLSDLAELTGYSRGYLANIKAGYPATESFKAICSVKLRRPISALFTEADNA